MAEYTPPSGWLLVPQAYLVALDPNAPEWDYTPFAQELERSYNWWRYLRYLWIVVRFEPAVSLGILLRRLIHPIDRLLILPAKGPADGNLPAEAWDWLNENLINEWGPQKPPGWIPLPKLPTTNMPGASRPVAVPAQSQAARTGSGPTLDEWIQQVVMDEIAKQSPPVDAARYSVPLPQIPGIGPTARITIRRVDGREATAPAVDVLSNPAQAQSNIRLATRQLLEQLR
jgi:hypothetical protein